MGVIVWVVKYASDEVPTAPKSALAQYETLKAKPPEVKAEAAAAKTFYPVPVMGGNTEMSNRLVGLLVQALAPVISNRVFGESHGCASVWAIGGWDGARRRNFVHVEILGGGMGASGLHP